MSFSVFQRARAALPHGAAQSLYKMLKPQRFAEFQRLHQAPAGTVEDISFVPLRETGSIFVHVPKAAGTSVGLNLYGCRTGEHMSLLDYRTAFPKKQFEAAFKFTFVRNPWDRLVSAFFYLKDDRRNDFDRDQAQRSVAGYDSFEAFVLEFLDTADVNALIHFREQHLFLRLPGRGIGVDFVGRYERLHEGFEHVAQRLGRNVALEHRNASDLRKADYRTLYTPAMIDRVAAVYARDIAAFEYTFD